MIILETKLKNTNGYVLRYQNVFGPGKSFKNPYSKINSIFKRLALENQEINVFEEGLGKRDFVYIEDVVNATISCLKLKQKGLING